MTEQTEQATTEAGAVPARIALEDFIEAVTRGVTRALAAQEDEVSGYLQVGGMLPPTPQPVLGRPSILVGFFPSLPGDQPVAKV